MVLLRVAIAEKSTFLRAEKDTNWSEPAPGFSGLDASAISSLIPPEAVACRWSSRAKTPGALTVRTLICGSDGVIAFDDFLVAIE